MNAPQYIVQPGHQFRLPDGTLAGPGDTVELADEVAAANPGAVRIAPPADEAHPAD